jgi:hypothetical protein
MRGPQPPSPTVASEALACASPAVARSFRLHRPRGAPCGTGYCGLCECSTPKGRGLACEMPAGLGRARAVDPLRPLGRLAERWPPWFWERRFLRPAPARRAYLELLRRLTAAGPLEASAPPVTARPFLSEEREELVVGRGGASEAGVVIGVYGDGLVGVVRPDALVELRVARLVLDTGSYLRLPPVRGNDLPGVVGLDGLERYGAAGALRRGVRLGLWGPPARRARARELAEACGAVVVWEDERAPRALLGRSRVTGIDAGGAVECDVFVTAVAQPAIELALAAGATGLLTQGELPVLVAADVPGWIELRGDAAATSSGVPDVVPDSAAFACPCEDVRVRDVRAAIASGFAHPELVKRRTGAMTGRCQGKLCSGLVLGLLRDAGLPSAPTTARPPARPLTLAELAADA